MYCSECGIKLDEVARFCPNCGKKTHNPIYDMEKKKEKDCSKYRDKSRISFDDDDTDLLEWENEFSAPEDDGRLNQRKWLFSIVLSAIILVVAAVILWFLLSHSISPYNSGIVVSP